MAFGAIRPIPKSKSGKLIYKFLIFANIGMISHDILLIMSQVGRALVPSVFKINYIAPHID